MNLRDYKLLIVDDHFLSRQMVSSTLKELGATTIDAATDGVSALDKIKTSFDTSEPYDIVLLDWSMPLMNGYDLLLALRADKRYNEMAILMLTAESEDVNIIKALEAGATAYMTKPFKPDMLIKKLDDVLAWQKKKAAL